MEPRKHYFAKIPTIAIFIVMAMSGPLGVLLFILKGIDQKVQKGRSPTGRVSLFTDTMCLPRRRKAPSNGTRILPPSAPSWVRSFCLPA